MCVDTTNCNGTCPECVGRRGKRNHLPDCMMPDGAEPCLGYSEAVDTIEALTAELDALKEQYRWVPVSERLPEEDCICWVYYPKTKEVGQDWFTRGAFVEDCMGKESCSYFIEIHEPEPPEQPL